MKMQRDVAIASASRNLGDQTQGLNSIDWKEGATVLDIGCGPGVHLDFFRTKGLIGTGLDRDPDNFLFHGEIEHVTDPVELGDRTFDYVFASHVLEHCPNTFEALSSWSKLIKPGGTLIIFVPPFWDEISNDHWCTGWNVGQLAMTLVAAGFDCKDSTFYQTSDQVFGFGVKRDIEPGFMITESLPYLPAAMAAGLYKGDGWQNLRADIAWVRGNQIEYLPRRLAMTTIPLPDDTWMRVEREGWQDAEAAPAKPLDRHGNYLFAVETEQPANVRLCFGYNGYTDHMEAWMQVGAGLTVRHFVPSELALKTPEFDITRTTQIAIGGPDPYVRAALFCDGVRVA